LGDEHLFNKWIYISLLTGIHFSSYASNLDLHLSGGPAISTLSNNSYLSLSPDVVNEYASDKQTVVEPLGAIGIGHTFKNLFHRPVDMALSLAGYYVYFGTVEGLVHPFVNAGQFDTSNYSFMAESYAAFIESRFIYAQYPWRPFIFAGIGASWNRLFDYDEMPTNPVTGAVVPPNMFPSHTQTAFAYEAGIGIQHLLFYGKKVQWLVSMDYRYMNLGEGKLGTLPTQTTDDTLKVNPMYTQGVVFTLQASL